MRLHHVQFNRFFRKKNPETLSLMSQQLGLQIPRRMGRQLVQQNVPLLKYIILRLDDINGTVTLKRRVRDEGESSAEVHDTLSLPVHLARAKSGVSSRSYPMSSRSNPKTGAQKQSRATTAVSLPSVPHNISNYLNTQVQQIIGSEGGGGEQEVPGEG